MREMAPGEPWVIFDADNTLWQVENLYDDARTLLCEYLSDRFDLDPERVEEYQQDRDHDLFAVFGYSACRFPRSFEDTILKFVPNVSSNPVRHVRRIASQVFERKAEPFEGVEETLKALSGQFKIGLVTSGERWVQEKRLGEFDYRGYFSDLRVIEIKGDGVFREFCKKNDVDILRSWLVGDSIRSDIIPAHNIGLKTVLVLHHHWSRVESLGHEVPPSTRLAESIAEVSGVILAESDPALSRASS